VGSAGLPGIVFERLRAHHEITNALKVNPAVSISRLVRSAEE